MHRSKRLRLGVLLLAAFHLGVAATVPVADAMLELESVGEPMHIEAERDVSCGDGHEHVFCQLCRSLSLGAPPRAIAHGGPDGIDGAPCRFRTDGSVARHVPSSGPVGSRAPPLA